MMLLSCMRIAATTTALVALSGMVPRAPQLVQNASTVGPENYPAPINLKVLPRDMTGAQVQEVMQEWKKALNMDCNGCHKENPKELDANGNPALNFADDSKPEKRTARVMYTMTEDINVRYIATIDSSGVPVTCGTCHRGHIGPEPMLFPLEENKNSIQNRTSATQTTKQP